VGTVELVSLSCHRLSGLAGQPTELSTTDGREISARLRESWTIDVEKKIYVFYSGQVFTFFNVFYFANVFLFLKTFIENAT